MNFSPIAASLANVMPLYIKTGLADSLCTIQQASQAPDPLGQPNLAGWTNVSGLVGIPCQLAPLIELRPQATDEVKLAEYTEEQSEFHLLLAGYYPQVLQQYSAVVDGIRYDILGIEADSQKLMTRLAVRQRTL